MTVADPCARIYDKHNSEDYPVYKCNTLKGKQKSEKLEKTCKFHNRNEGTKEVKSQTNNNKMHDPYHKYIILNLFIHRTAI